MRLRAVALAALLLFPAPSFAVTRASERINDRLYAAGETVWYKLNELVTGDKWVRVKDIVLNPEDDAVKPGGDFAFDALHGHRDNIISNENNVTGPKIEPLNVVPTPDGKWMPYDGNHRLRAAQETQLEWIRINVIPKKRR